jgi:chemotaxis protein MotB
MSAQANTAIPEDEGAPGTPAWMATFADLMSLLMCFFVLLLSFSEMDLQKYKQVAGSMKNAFGVQNQTKVMDIPKGTSIIAQEFSPGKTPANDDRDSQPVHDRDHA